VATILRETGLSPKCLKLEITESMVMENMDSAVQMLRQLRALGIALSIDDFGTGYSSLSYLHRFPINTLKIDKSFVTRMADNAENGEIVRTIITLAKSLGMDVVAEGVETEAQLEQLKALSCQYGQGYLFSRPVDKIHAYQLLTDESSGQGVPYLSNLETILAA
jgi:EAL domain-containing protein (putative c-di-GMP-specific phosphodiesterase class I)